MAAMAFRQARNAFLGAACPQCRPFRKAVCLQISRMLTEPPWTFAGFGTQLEHVCGVARSTRRAHTPRVAQTIPRTLQPQSQIATRVILRPTSTQGLSVEWPRGTYYFPYTL